MKGTVSLVPNALLKPEETSTEKEESLLLRLNWNNFSKQRDRAASRADRTSSDALARVFWQFFFVSVIQIQRIDVKFHNQLHFKSYLHIPGHDETLLREGPDMIPVDVDSNAFYLQFRYLPREIKIRDSLSAFTNPPPQGIAKPLDVKYYLKMEWHHQFISFEMYDSLLF